MRFFIRRVPVFFILISFAFVFAVGVLVGRYEREAENTAPDRSEGETSYQFINPLLYCEDHNVSNRSVRNMEDAVTTYIQKEKERGTLIDASFYFRDLNGGPWSLVNPDVRSLPASLLKVPLAIAIYQRAEKDPGFLTKQVVVEHLDDVDASSYFPPKKRIQTNVTYTIEDVVRLMLQESDNAALYVLNSLVNQTELRNAYTHLGIDSPTDQSGAQDYTMTAKTYASFFRILYGGTYLSRDHSEHILSLLSESSFTDGLVAGLPKGIPVAHKFGESTSVKDGTLQLHDCGIVYKPNQPYLICVMTKGYNFDILAKIIAHISKTTFELIDD